MQSSGRKLNRADVETMVSSACAQLSKSEDWATSQEGATDLNSSFYRYPLPTHYRLISITPSHVHLLAFM